MRTPIVLCLLLSIAAGSVLAESPAPKEASRADSAKPREGDAARKAESGCERESWVIPAKTDTGSPDWIIPAKPAGSSGDARR